MKKTLLILPLLASTVLGAQSLKGIYEITAPERNSFDWHGIRSLDSKDQSVLLKNKSEEKKTRQFTAFKPEAIDRSQPIPTNAAALAYDETSNRLFYVTMHTGQLRSVNLRAKNIGEYKEIGTVQDLTVNNMTQQMPQDKQGPVITRLTIANNNYGYGLSNDGNTFFKFSLNKKTEIKQLGALKDDPNNGAMSIHHMQTSWGGDMVAGADGNLYLISAYQNVFKIDPSTNVATFVAKISGLHQLFTINGAAVTEEGHLLLSSANYFYKRAIVKDFDTWKAESFQDNNAGSSSDLASAYLLFNKKKETSTIETITKTASLEKTLQAYPNPTNLGYTNIALTNVSGDVVVELFDVNGAAISKNISNVSVKSSNVRINTNTLSKGSYLVKITDNKTKETFNSKIIVQ